MEQRNCKNCGAPLQHSYNHKCPYCHTLYDFNANDNLTIDFENITDVNFSECRYDIDGSIILYFRGVQIEKPKMYEIENGYQVSTTLFESKKCFCAIRIDNNSFKKYKMGYFMHLLVSHFYNLSDGEISKLKSQILNDKTFIKYIYKNQMFIGDEIIY